MNNYLSSFSKITTCSRAIHVYSALNGFSVCFRVESKSCVNPYPAGTESD